MDIKIIGEHLPVTEALSNYIQDKFSNVPQPEKLNVVEFRVGTEKNQQYVHFKTHCYNEDIVIKTQDENLYTAVDKMMKKISRSFVKVKEKNNVPLIKEQRIKPT